MKKLKEINFVDYTFVIPAFVFMAIFMVYPVIYNFMLSFTDSNLSNLVSGGQQFIGFENYKAVLQNTYFFNSVKNTAIFMSICLIFQFIFGMILALFFNKNFYGSKWMRAIVLIGWMNPIIITGAIFKWLLSGDFGVLNYLLMNLGLISQTISWLTDPSTALISLIIANIWIGIPFNMIMLLSGLQDIPETLYEAADIDGANRVQKFFEITFPLLKPTIFVLLMMGIIYTFKVFDLIFIMTKGGPARSSQILPYFSYELSFQMYKFGEGAAVSVIIFLIISLFACLYLKTIRREDE